MISENDYKFTYETDDEYYQHQRSGYVDDYNIVRMNVIYSDGYNVDYPVRTKEELVNELNRISNIEGTQILKVYSSIHSFNINDYD